MLRFCLGAYGRPNHAWMPSLGAGLIRLSQAALAPEPTFSHQLNLPRESSSAWHGSRAEMISFAGQAFGFLSGSQSPV